MDAAVSELDVLGVVPFGREKRHFALRLAAPAWANWEPGQFVMVRPASFGLELPWGRPFSICSKTGRHLILFFRVCGKGTERLAALRQGDKLLIWGPLGRGFAMEQDRPILLLAGGMGIAPFVGYAYRHPQPWNLSLLFGHRDPLDSFPVDSINERIPVDSLRESDPEDLDNFIYTMEERIRDCAGQNGLALACGPEGFLRTAQKFAKKFGCAMQLSIERRMACGVGACLGCVCHREGSSRPVQTCLEGPVFPAEEVRL